MASPNLYPIVDDKDLDDAALWAVIDSAAASHSSSKYKPQSPKPLAIKYPNYPSPPPKLFKTPRLPFSDDSGSKSLSTEGEVVEDPSAFHPPRKIARTSSSGVNDTSPLVVVRNVQRTTPTTPTTPFYSSPETHVSPGIGNYASPVSYGQRDGRDNSSGSVHSLTGRFPSVSLFKEYQNAAMAILEKTDYTMISGHPFIKKSGWRKISFYFNLSFEIKDKTIEFDENRNVLRAEFVVRAHMQGGRFSDGWGACDRREKKFNKPNHDIPSTAETRAKSKASQDLLGIGEYRPGASQFHH
ncbi:PREDICTED: LOC107478037 isoform [Prunus dulcis]|uniref:PREDICTED: LOC107478037 isoform n=1 Tax=Prunus dulcis TaxID=3755 RepID=A0A5E4F4H9_PRUDU|nr:uncharacterized protein LOC117631836 isoform X1 [Prunus dulcis]KAI5325609.1 hypothetical protein L3X38_034683 [Prunus dulcis]VVA22622.1 PREDICTED: LOC107478037 isoform [Prunus dulcis]